jgi:CRP/FNR family transcriptional regulator
MGPHFKLYQYRARREQLMMQTSSGKENSMLIAGLVPPDQELEDPLAYLSCSRIVEFPKGAVIYGWVRPSTGLYLIIDGAVKVQRIIGEQVAALLFLYGTDELFGESAFTGSCSNEVATALDKTRVMTWSQEEVEDSISRRPRLGFALVQLLAQFMPLAHESLAQYVGTCREVVTLHLVQFRRKGYVRYSRKEIVLYPAALRQWLNEQPSVPAAGVASSM